MSDWAVVHLVRICDPRYARTTEANVARLIVSEVPEDVGAEAIRRALTRSGRTFGEGAIPWANHYLSKQEHWPNEVVGARARRDAPSIAWADLVGEAEAQRAITLRLTPEQHAAFKRAAAASGQSLQQWAVAVLAGAAGVEAQ